jgi:SAM-dependent methyltransferase
MPDYTTLYDRRRLEILGETIPAGSGSALDVGCNDGTITQLVADKGYRPVGVDIDAEVVTTGRRLHPDLDLRVGSLETVKDAAPFRLVTCLEVLEHIPSSDRRPFLEQLTGLVDRQATLVVSTPGRYSLYSLYDRVASRARGHRRYDWWDPSHVDVMSWRGLRVLLRAFDFEPSRLIGYHYLPSRLAAPIAVRRWPLNRAGFDLVAVFVRRVR